VQLRADRVEDDIERADLLGAGGGVVEDLVGAQVGQGGGVAVAGQRGDVAADGVGQLHGGGADPARGAPDQDAFPAGKPYGVAQCEQGGRSGDDQGGRVHRRDHLASVPAGHAGGEPTYLVRDGVEYGASGAREVHGRIVVGSSGAVAAGVRAAARVPARITAR